MATDLSRLAALAGVSGEPEVLADRGGRLVVAFGDRVVKTHHPDGAAEALTARLAAASRPELAAVLLAPISVTVLDGQVVTVWPRGEPVDPESAAPWAEAGDLLARLHLVPARGLPGCGAPARLARALRALTELPGGSARSDVLAAYAALPPAGPAAALVHGDWHLGQLVRVPGSGWRLADVDDLGVGDPAGDLGRPAAWFACGIIPPEAWDEILGTYRAAGGPAVPPTGDPWPTLDLAARTLTVQSAAQALVRCALAGRALDEPEEALVDACGRMIARA